MENIWTERVEAEWLTVSNSPSVLEITEPVGPTKTVGDGVLSFEHELVWFQRIDTKVEVNGLEGTILFGFGVSILAANHQVGEHFLELPVLGTLVLLALPHQEGKTWASCVLLGNVRRPTVLDATVQIKPQPSMAASAYVLRENPLPQSIQGCSPSFGTQLVSTPDTRVVCLKPTRSRYQGARSPTYPMDPKRRLTSGQVERASGS